ncbi:MAG: glycosyltransferase family 9 protein, partial [Candidatus Eisenbacteria sp.]|nr:glycosyltransferase family 9 protein [Candidatus Eisenbacteria bacterium]
MSTSTSGKLVRKTPGTAAWPVDSWPGPLLLVRLSSLGDLVLATAALELIHKRRPELAIDVLTRRPYAPVLRGLEAIGSVLLDDASSSSARGRAPAQASSALPYATVLDLQGGQKGRRAGQRWAPGAQRITYERASLQRRLLVLCGRRMKGPEPLVVRFARAVAGGALETTALQPKVAVDVDRRRVIGASLSTPARPKRGWVVLAPSASRRLKAVPERLSGALQEGLLKRSWGVIRLLPPDAPLTGATEGHAGGALLATLAGRDGEPVRTFSGPLPDVMALLASVSVVISSDSGIL